MESRAGSQLNVIAGEGHFHTGRQCPWHAVDPVHTSATRDHADAGRQYPACGIWIDSTWPASTGPPADPSEPRRWRSGQWLCCNWARPNTAGRATLYEADAEPQRQRPHAVCMGTRLRPSPPPDGWHQLLRVSMWGLVWQQLLPSFLLGRGFDSFCLHGWGVWAVVLMCQALPALCTFFVFVLLCYGIMFPMRGRFSSCGGSEGGALRSLRRPTGLGGRVPALAVYLAKVLRTMWLQGVCSSNLDLRGEGWDATLTGATSMCLLPSGTNASVPWDGGLLAKPGCGRQLSSSMCRDQGSSMCTCAVLEMQSVSQSGQDGQQVLYMCSQGRLGIWSVPPCSLIQRSPVAPADAVSKHGMDAGPIRCLHSHLSAPKLAPALSWCWCASSEDEEYVCGDGHLAPLACTFTRADAPVSWACSSRYACAAGSSPSRAACRSCCDATAGGNTTSCTGRSSRAASGSRA